VEEQSTAPEVEKPYPIRYNYRVGTSVFILSKELPEDRSGWWPFGLLEVRSSGDAPPLLFQLTANICLLARAMGIEYA
jgi:hypothetical protein